MGNLDEAFGSDGVLIFSGTGSDRAHRVCELEDGRIAILVLSDSRDDLFTPFTGAPSLEETYVFIVSNRGDIQRTFPIGGSLDDKPTGMIFNSAGRIVITGCTESRDGVFPDAAHHGEKDVFVMELDGKKR